jgi:two-component system chemotaxis response regulator CheB
VTTRVLVVDDSAFVRKVVTEMLNRGGLEVVGFARDGEEALELAERLHPDVITLDLVMPRMNGVEFLRAQNRRRRIPVVICSIAHESGELALEALEEGAVEFVQKPTALATDRVYEIARELVAKVQAAAATGVDRTPAVSGARTRPIGTAPVPVVPLAIPEQVRSDIVVLGISTGGPQALRQVIPRLPADLPVPVAMVMHMPVGYTAMYAHRLDSLCGLDVCEAREGDEVRAGRVLLAPAGRHLSFLKEGGMVRAHLDDHPTTSQHRPAVDVLFRSAADVFGPRVLGVVMTGMGNDGLLGAAHIKAQGGRIVTEAESSCVVYGMPRVIDEASLSDRSATLDHMARVIVEMI